MTQVFRPRANALFRLVIACGVLGLGSLAWAGWAIYRSSYFTGVDVPVSQPVPFSHKHHVRGLGIDCRFCHTTVETSRFAGIPPTSTCMTCHSQVWTNASILEPVRESFPTGTPLRWTRVHDLPDFVYFDHSIHVNKGVGCSTCHGQVDEMPITWRANTLFMRWCLECHRAPEKYLRPKESVFDMSWRPPPDQVEQGRRLMREYKVRSLTDCTVCHR